MATPTADIVSGDFDGNGRVDGRDLIMVALAMDACQGDSSWNPSTNADLSATCPPSPEVCGPPGDLQRIDQADADVVLAEFGSLIAVP